LTPHQPGDPEASMPILKLSELDVFALVDADTAEARTYTTYFGYWDCLARSITDNYSASPNEALVRELQGRSTYQNLSSRKYRGDRELLRSFLLNGWNSELGLYLVDEDDPRLQPANQWNGVYAYYATGRMALAWLLARDHQAPNRHRPMLRALSAQIAGSSLYPMPWSMCCTSLHPTTWQGCPEPPAECSNLASNLRPIDGLGKMLSTTRQRRVDELVSQRKERLGLRRAPNGEARRQNERLEATTVFDFAWRSRTRSNYGDPSMFYMGSLGDQSRSQQLLSAVRTWTNATMLLFEAFLGQRASDLVTDAAVHYMSRDRTKISDGVLGERLRALGMI